MFPKGIRSAGPKIGPDRIPYDTGNLKNVHRRQHLSNTLHSSESDKIILIEEVKRGRHCITLTHIHTCKETGNMNDAFS